jgi:hypothetical protein
MPEGMALEELALRVLIPPSSYATGPRSARGPTGPPVKAAPEEGRATTDRYGAVSVR